MFAIHWCRASARSATNAFSVNRIRDAYAGTAIAPVRSELADLDVDAAYAIQQENTAHWQAKGRHWHEAL